MFKNYLSIAFRTIRKHKLYSFINVVGLAVGLASFFVIGMFVRLEQSFDDFHEKGDRIFRVVQNQPNNLYLGSTHFGVTPAVLPKAMMEEVPSVELATQITNVEALLTVKGKGFNEKGLFATDTFFDVFTFPLVSGDSEGMLSRPEDFVISESLAQKIFGRTDVLGESIEMATFGDPLHLTISGVMKDVPANSHLQFDYVASFMSNTFWLNSDGWGNNSYYTYGLSVPGVTRATIDADIKELADRHLSETSWIKDNPDDLATFYTQPLREIHLYSRVNFDLAVLGDIRYVWLFSGVAFLILVMACVNYMNLATARAAIRAREVGIRKVAGAARSQLVRQFIGEAVATASIASVLSLGLVALVIPTLNALVERNIQLSSLFQPGPILFILLTGLAVGAISGSYPALFLSRMQPAAVLKGSIKGKSRSSLRNVLVVGQFALGIVMVLGVIVIQQQMTFVSNYDTGVTRDHIVAVRVRDQDIRTDPAPILERIAAISTVSAVSSGNNLPIRITSNSSVSEWEGSNEGDEFHLWNSDINFGYEAISGLQFVAGEGFSREKMVDTEEGLLLNQAAVRALGWTDEEAVGKTLDFQGKTRVLGVLQDFHFQSMRETIAPLALKFDASRSGYLMARIDAKNVPGTLKELKAIWDDASGKYPFEYEFMDDAFNKQYQTELRLASVLKMFTFLALLVAGLGLFGLAAFTAQQRTREIGIRKVLGASVPSIVLLMSKDFGLLVGAAFVIGAPLAYLFMVRWLDAFAYKISIGISTFAWGGAAALVLASIAVGYQAIRASLANPVQSLRSE
ncbi:ABC transporter permease [bacterium]|nr:ABC transporter permease [bacterium]